MLLFVSRTSAVVEQDDGCCCLAQGFRGKPLLYSTAAVDSCILMLTGEQKSCCYWEAGILFLLVGRTATACVVGLLPVWFCCCWCSCAASGVVVLLLVQPGLLLFIRWCDLPGLISFVFSGVPCQTGVQHAPELQQIPPRGAAPVNQPLRRAQTTHLLVAMGARPRPAPPLAVARAAGQPRSEKKKTKWR